MAKKGNSDRKIIIYTGLATFFFGFFAGALLNWYWILVDDPFVEQFRSTLNYTSAIIGDGIVLPLVNMLMVAFLLKVRRYLTLKIKFFGFIFGLLITLYFHITQALEGIVNWAMPEPWHWNLLGLWHFFYMLAVATLISTFYLVCFKVIKKEKRIPKSIFIVSLGILFFLVLLRLDYISVDLF